MTEEKPCPVCGDNYIESSKSLESWPGKRYTCRRCGMFDIDSVIEAYSRSGQHWNSDKHLVSAWIRRQNNLGVTPNIGKGIDGSIDDWVKQLNYMGFPETPSEKMNKLLQVYANSIKNDYGGQITRNQPYYIAEIAAKNLNEVAGLTQMLEELSLFKTVSNQITAHGWLRIQELNTNIAENNSAFVAMWFDDSTKIYRDSVTAAINHCGYDPVIVDQKEYNGFIMDQVVSLIKQSRFLVADFTTLPEIEKAGKVKNGVRGGVYWEAGMAYGLGRQVIHTCKDHEESKRRIHFDVNQYNTIYWKEEELGTKIRPHDQPNSSPNFAEKLVVRILSTVGRGNNPPTK